MKGNKAIGVMFGVLFVAVLMMPLASALPTIDVTSAQPDSGSTLNGYAEFRISVSDSTETPVVKIYIDDTYMGTMLVSGSSPTYTFYLPVDTSCFEDGRHMVRFDASDSEGEDSKSYYYTFDNSPPEVRNITVHYPYGDAVPGKVDFYITAEVSDMTGIENLSINVSALQPTGNTTLLMYDDGKHNDGAAGDGIYGTEAMQSLADDGTYYLNISATDTLSNHRNYSFSVSIDSTAPSISSMEAVLPYGQSSLKAGDSVRFRAYISDEAPGYVREAWINASGLGIDGATLYDDGNHDDGAAGDGVYSTDVLTVSAEGDGDVRVYFSARDRAGNMGIRFITGVVLDNERPSVDSITVSYPTNQSWAKDGDSVTVNVSASDSVGVERVVLDASEIGGSDSIEMMYSGGVYTADVTVYSGEYTGALRVKATAYDGAGNTDSLYMNVVLNNSGNESGNNYTIIVVVNDTGNSSSGDQNCTVVVVVNGTANGNGTATGSAPSIEYLSVHDGSVLSGEVEISAVIWNESALQKAVLYLGDSEISMTYGADRRYHASIDTTGYDDGTQMLTVSVRDSENRSASVNIEVIVDNTAPSLELMNRPSGKVSGIVEILAQASDISGIKEVNLSIGDRTISMLSQNGLYMARIDTETLSDGTHMLTVSASNGAGLTHTSSFFIETDNTAPSVEFNGPYRIMRNESVSFNISGAEEIWMRVDGGDWMGLFLTGRPLIYPGSLVDSEGVHYIELKALDEAGNVAEESAAIYIEFPAASEGGDDGDEGDEGVTPMPGEDENTESSDMATALSTMSTMMYGLLGLLALIILLLALSMRGKGKQISGAPEEISAPVERNPKK